MCCSPKNTSQKDQITLDRQVFDSLLDRIRELEALVARQAERIKELEDRLSKNSRNSSKPPSSDGYTKPSPKSRRKKTGRKPGGQPGHKPARLEPVANPDRIIEHKPDICKHCKGLIDDSTLEQTQARQVFDLPPINLHIEEHRIFSGSCCCCGRTTESEFPENVSAHTQYGPNIAAMAVHLNIHHAMPVKRISEFIHDHVGANAPSSGTISSWIMQAAKLAQPTIEEIRQGLVSSPVNHFDETGIRINGKNRWLHNVSNVDATLQTTHEKRGKEGIQSPGVIEEFEGVAVHDCWGPYFSEHKGPHGLCNAHLLRELEFFAEKDSSSWTHNMVDFLCRANDAAKTAREKNESICEDRLKEFREEYAKIISAALNSLPPPPERKPGKRGRKARGKERCLLDRMYGHEVSVLRFLQDLTVPFDNNQAERDIRMVKVKMKVSGGFRSKTGAEAYTILRSYIETARKQAHNAFEELVNLFRKKPFTPIFK